MNNIDLRRDLRDSKERLQIRQAYYLDLLGLIVPLAAPLVPAYLTATAIIEHYPALLHLDRVWVIVMAFIAGAVIEVLGILSIETMFDMRTFNATVQGDDERAPFGYAASAVVFYLLLVITLVLLLKIWSGLALWSLAPLTVLGFITSWVMVLRKQHADRVWRVEVQGAEQSEVERLNATIERMNDEHAAALNAERERVHSLRAEHAEHVQRLRNEHVQRFERLQAEHSEQMADEQRRREQIENELASLREQYARLVDSVNSERVQRTPKRTAKKDAPTKVDPVRVQHYFMNDPNATVRQAADDLGYSIGSITKYKPPIVHTNGHNKQETA